MYLYLQQSIVSLISDHGLILGEACRGGSQFINNDHTPIQSPRYGNRNYPNDAKCIWEVAANQPGDVCMTLLMFVNVGLILL